MRPESGLIRPDGPILANLGPVSADFGPKSTEVARARPILASSGPSLPNFGHIRGASNRFRPGCGQINLWCTGGGKLSIKCLLRESSMANPKSDEPEVRKDDIHLFRRRFWPRTRCSRSRHCPTDRVGTSNIDSSANIGAGERSVGQLRATSANFRAKSQLIGLRATDDPQDRHPMETQLSYPPTHTQQISRIRSKLSNAG